MIFLLPPVPPESSSPNAAKDGASIALTELNIGIGGASCDGLAGSDATVVFSFVGGAITCFAGAAAAADPGADVRAELGFWAVTGAAAIFAASFLITSFLITSFLITPGEAGCRASTAGSAAIVVWVCAAGAGTTAGWFATFADAVIAGNPAGSPARNSAGSGASNSGSSVRLGGGVIAAAPRLAGWNELPVD